MPVIPVSNSSGKTHSSQLDYDRREGVSTLLSGASVVLLGMALSRLFDFIARTALGRYLGPEQFGLLTSGIAVLSIAGTLVLAGTPRGLVRFVGQYRGARQEHRIPGLIRTVFWFVALSGALVGLMLWLLSDWVAVTWLRNPLMGEVLRFVGLGLLPFALLSILSAILQAEKDAASHTLLNSLLLPLLRLSGVGLAILVGWHLRYIMSVYFVLALLVPVILGIMLVQKKYVRMFELGDMSGGAFRALLVFSLPLLLGSLLALTVWQVDVLLLQRVWGAYVTGLYSAAITIARLPNMVLLALSFMLAPFVAQLYSSSRLQEMQRMYGRIVDLVFMLALPVFTAFALFAPLLLGVLFGANYVSAVPLLRVLAVGFFLHSITGPNGNSLVMMGFSRLYLLDTALVAVAAILLYAFLIPPLEAMGAALATIASLLLMNGIFSIQLFVFAKINPFPWLRITLLVPAVLAGSVAYLTERILSGRLPDWLLLAVVLCTLFALYLVLALLLRIVRRDEVIALKNLLKWTRAV